MQTNLLNTVAPSSSYSSIKLGTPNFHHEDLWVKIIQQADFSPVIKLVSICFSRAYKRSIESLLFASYQASPLLKVRALYIDNKKPKATSKQKAQSLYEHLLNDVKQMKGGAFERLLLENHAPISVKRLEKLELWLEDMNLIEMFQEVGKINARAHAIVLNIQKQDHQVSQADIIRDWMKGNRPIPLDEDKLSIIKRTRIEAPYMMAKFGPLEKSARRLTKLPPEMGLLTPLQELDISDNKLISLPAQFGHLAQLKILNLGSNKLMDLPTEFKLLERLQSLDLSHNKFSTLPAEILGFAQLTELHLENNKLSCLPDGMEKLKKLKMLNLSFNRLKDLSIKIERFVQLTDLHLEHNRLSALSAKIGDLTQLQILHLEHNQLSAVTAKIGHLTQLQILHLEYNQITALPSEIGQLTKLTKLQLEYNQLTSLPVTISGLFNLHHLHLNYNKITVLPKEIKEMVCNIECMRQLVNPKTGDIWSNVFTKKISNKISPSESAEETLPIAQCILYDKS